MNIVRRLHLTGKAEFEGVTLVHDPSPLKPGDVYLAERNVGPQLLTVRVINIGAVFPVEQAYPYDLHECAKVFIKE